MCSDSHSAQASARGGGANTAQRRGIHQLLMKERTKAGRNKILPWIEEPDKRRLSWKQKNNAMVGGVKRCIKDIKERVRRNYQGWEIWASHE